MVVAIGHTVQRAGRRTGRVAIVLALVAAVVTVLAAPAQAFPGVCSPAPPDVAVPEAQLPEGSSPSRGLGPDVSPFKHGSPSTVYSRYGLAGLQFHMYDQGCLPNPGANAANFIANVMMETARGMTGFSSDVTHAALHTGFLDVFDPLISQSVSVLYHNVFLSLGAIVIIIVGLGILWVGREGAISRVTTYAATAALVFIAVTLLAQYPVRAGHAVDATAASVIGTVNQKLTSTPEASAGTRMSSAARVQSNLGDAGLYPAWVRGTFGSADSPAATKYAGQLFDAQTLTRREARRYYADPSGAGQKLVEQKKAQYKETAKKIKQADPSAYAHLQGNHPGQRLTAAFLAMAGAIAGTWMLVLAGILVILALTIVRLAVMLFPLFAVLGMHHRFVNMLTGTLNTVAGAVVLAVMASVVAALDIRALGVVLDPSNGLSLWLRLVLLLVLAIGGVTLIWKWRHLTKPVRLHSAPADQSRVFANTVGAGPAAGGRAWRAGKKLTGKAAGWVASGAVAGTVAGNVATEEAEDDEPPPNRPEATPAAPSPPPPAPAGPQLGPAPADAPGPGDQAARSRGLGHGPGTWVDEPGEDGVFASHTAEAHPHSGHYIMAERDEHGTYHITSAEARARPQSRFDPRVGFTSGDTRGNARGKDDDA